MNTKLRAPALQSSSRALESNVHTLSMIVRVAEIYDEGRSGEITMKSMNELTSNH